MGFHRSLLVRVPRESDFLLANRQIPGVHDLRDDVHAIVQIEVDEIRLAVFDFVNGRLLRERPTGLLGNNRWFHPQIPL
jgi:hypothetical protein